MTVVLLHLFKCYFNMVSGMHVAISSIQTLRLDAQLFLTCS